MHNFMGIESVREGTVLQSQCTMEVLKVVSLLIMSHTLYLCRAVFLFVSKGQKATGKVNLIFSRAVVACRPSY